MSESQTVIVIKTKADGKAAEAMEKMARATKAAANAEEKYQDKLKSRGGVAAGLERATGRQLGRGLGAGRLGGLLGGQLGSGLGGIGAALGVSIAGYAALSTAASKTAQAIDVLGNGALTAAQKQDALVKMIPGAESFLRLRDAITGVTESLRKLNESQQFALLRQGYEHEKEQRDMAARAELGRYENRGRAFGRAKVPGTLNDLAGGRSTFGGEIAYQEAATRFPAQVALERAHAEAKAAAEDMKESQVRMGRMEVARAKLIDNMNMARAGERQAVASGNVFGADAGESRVSRTERGLKALQAEQEVLNNQAQIEQELNRQKEIGVQLAQKESAVRKAQINLQKAELQILQAREQRQSSAATSLGMMTPAQQAMAVAGLKMVQSGNVPLGMLPPSLRGLVQSVAPGYLNKIAETQGANSEAFKQFQEAGAVDKGTLEETRKELAKVQTQVEVNINLDEQVLAEQVAKQLSASLSKLIDTINAKFQAEGERLRSGNQLRNALINQGQ